MAEDTTFAERIHQICLDYGVQDMTPFASKAIAAKLEDFCAALESAPKKMLPIPDKPISPECSHTAKWAEQIKNKIVLGASLHPGLYAPDVLSKSSSLMIGPGEYPEVQFTGKLFEVAVTQDVLGTDLLADEAQVMAGQLFAMSEGYAVLSAPLVLVKAVASPEAKYVVTVTVMCAKPAQQITTAGAAAAKKVLGSAGIATGGSGTTTFNWAQGDGSTSVIGGSSGNAGSGGYGMGSSGSEPFTKVKVFEALNPDELSMTTGAVDTPEQPPW